MSANPPKSYCVIVNAVVFRGNRVLLAQRSKKEKHVPGCWSPPGGKLEEVGVVWNALEQTAKREVLEETGVEIQDKMELIVNNTFNHDEDDLLVIALVFLCFYKSGEALALEDTIDVRWVGEEELDNYEFTHQNVKDYVIKAFEVLKAKKKQ